MKFLSFFVLSGGLIFSFGAFANVGSVDSRSGQKAAACVYAQESRSDKTASRDVNPANILANLVDQTEERPVRRERRGQRGSGKSVQ